MNSVLLLWPMVVMALVTLALYPVLARVRIASVKRGDVKPAAFKLNDGEPEASRRINNAIQNQFDSPVLFYAACLTLYLTNGTSPIMLFLVWAYVCAKTVHVLVHVTINKLRIRRNMFLLSWFILVILWLAIAVHLTVKG